MGGGGVGGSLDWPFFHPLEITNNRFQSADIDFTGPPCICDNDPGTSSVVASPFCLVELCLAIFFARIFLFSRCRERNRFFMPLEFVASVQNKEEPPAHFKKRFCLF